VGDNIDGKVYAVDASTTRVLFSRQVGYQGGDGMALAAAGDSVWVWSANTALSRIDATTGDVRRFGFELAPGDRDAIASGEGSIWLASNSSGDVGRIDPRALSSVPGTWPPRRRRPVRASKQSSPRRSRVGDVDELAGRPRIEAIHAMSLPQSRWTALDRGHPRLSAGLSRRSLLPPATQIQSNYPRQRVSSERSRVGSGEPPTTRPQRRPPASGFLAECL
jgi:hypothetical protein